MIPNLITRLKEEWNNLDPVDPLRGLIADAIDALSEQPAQQEPFGFMTAKSGWGSAQTEMVMKITRKAQPEYGLIKPLYTSPQPSKPLTDEQINLFINGRGEEGDDDYVEPTGDGFGLTDADLVRLVRRVEAAHGIMSVPDGKGDA